MSIKICIIGAGSAVFSLTLIKDLCLNDRLQGSRLALMDVNPERLDNIYHLARRYLAETGNTMTLEATLDRREALQGADFVINVAMDYGHGRLREGWDIAYRNGYRNGGSLHIVHDEAFWVNYYQVRLMESILRDVLEICPEAWYILVANPVQMGVTYLARKYPQVKIVGFCHGVSGVYRLTKAMWLDAKDISFDFAGVNHFIWLTKFFYKGEDAFPLLDEWIESGRARQYLEARTQISIAEGPKALDLYRTYGAFPIGDTSTPGGGSWGWWYHTDDAEEEYAEDPFKWYQLYFSHCEWMVRRMKEVVQDKDTPVSEAFLLDASGEPIVPLIESLAIGTERTLVVNILNSGGYVPGIPTDY